MVGTNPLMLLYAEYLYTNGYNTYDEVMSMNSERLEDRFNKITGGEVI